MKQIVFSTHDIAAKAALHYIKHGKQPQVIQSGCNILLMEVICQVEQNCVCGIIMEDGRYTVAFAAPDADGKLYITHGGVRFYLDDAQYCVVTRDIVQSELHRCTELREMAQQAYAVYAQHAAQATQYTRTKRAKMGRAAAGRKIRELDEHIANLEKYMRTMRSVMPDALERPQQKSLYPLDRNG